MQAQAQVLPPPLPPMNGDLTMKGWMSANQRGFFMDGESISVKQAKKYVWTNRDALRHIRRGQGWQIGAVTLATVGGGLIGMDIGNAIAGEKINGAGIAFGLLVVGGGFGLELISISHYKKAAAAYNNATGLYVLPRHEVNLALAPTNGGVGLQLTF